MCSSVPSTDALTADTKDILEELTRFLNLEKLLPSYRFTVTVRWVYSNVYLVWSLESQADIAVLVTLSVTEIVKISSD